MKLYGFRIAISIAVSFTCCVGGEEEEGALQAGKNYSGEQLAKVYCGSCHQYPEPSLLPADIWEQKVLPVMGQKLGIPDFNLAMATGYVPVADVHISDSNWHKIKHFYLDNALYAPELDSNEYPFTEQFDVKKPITFPFSFTTSLTFDAEKEVLYVGHGQSLYTFGTKLNLMDSITLSSPATEVEIHPDRLEVLCIGKFLPNDLNLGELFVQDMESGKLSTLIDSLKRPVHFASLDLNNNGMEEKVICEYGNESGLLSVFVRENNSWKKIVFPSTLGARKVLGYDFDHNGYTDLMVQFSQGDERISIFYNDNMEFREEVLVRFPPVYGASSFDTLDFNGDGRLDFFVVFGDNADYSPVLKPYHGLKIFEQEKQDVFSEKVFVPIFGATDAKAGDFDLDGDIDFAVIAHFADFEHAPQHSFLYLENVEGHLEPRVVEALPEGKWLRIESADYDMDGDMDFFLGAMKMSSRRRKNQQLNHYPYVLLENKGR